MRVVRGLLIHEEQVLLVEPVKRPGRFELPGGKVKMKKNETDLEAITRELKEETNAKLKKAEVVYQMEDEDVFAMTCFHVLEADTSDLRPLRPHEIRTVAWFTKDELPYFGTPETLRFISRYCWRQRRFLRPDE